MPLGKPQVVEYDQPGVPGARGFAASRNELAVPEAQSSRYPFLAALTEVQEAVREVTGKPYAWYVQDLGRHEELLLDLKESILDPVRRFMGGSQKAIYDESMASTSFALVIIGIAAVVTLLLGFVGLYGVMAFIVARRPAESFRSRPLCTLCLRGSKPVDSIAARQKRLAWKSANDRRIRILNAGFKASPRI